MYFLNIENTTHTKKRCACTPHMGNRGARAREATRRIPYLRVVFFSFSPHPQIIPTSSHSLSTSRVGAVCLAGRSIPATIRLPRPSCPARSVRRSTRAASTFFHHHLLNFFFCCRCCPSRQARHIYFTRALDSSRSPTEKRARSPKRRREPSLGEGLLRHDGVELLRGDLTISVLSYRRVRGHG